MLQPTPSKAPALLAALLATMTAIPLLGASDAGAVPRRFSAGDNGDRTGFVVAHSRHGNGSVSGPVRLARYGREVRLPGGTWIACRRSCSETLRVETVDFWEGGPGGGGGAITNECGIFGCLELRWPR
jgi:hypothetical protein